MLPYRATRRSADNSRSLLCNDAYGFRGVMVMPRLFDLPALQKTCGQRWGWTADKTLSVAQELYDGDGKRRGILLLDRKSDQRRASQTVWRWSGLSSGSAEASAYFSRMNSSLGGSEPQC